MSASTEKKLRQAAREAGTDKKTLAAQEAEKKQRSSRRRWTLGSILVLLLVLAIVFLNTGLIYTMTTALKVGEVRYTPAQVNYYYSLNFANLASMFGADANASSPAAIARSMAKQDSFLSSEGTWRDYVLDMVGDDLARTQVLLDYAAQEGVSLDEADTAQVDANFEGLDQYARLQGFGSGNAMLGYQYGSGVNQKLLRALFMDSSLASKAYTALTESFSYSDEALEQRYVELEGAEDLFRFAYCYVAAETVEPEAGSEDESAAPTEETRAAAREQAQALLAAYKTGKAKDDLERLQAAAAEAALVEPMEQELKGASLSSAYKDWLTDDSRKAGDAAVLPDGEEEPAGYYVLLFLEREDNSYPVAQVRHILIRAETDENGEYSEETKAAAKARAEELLAQWASGDKSEESFAALAEEFSEDEGSKRNGGLYDQVYKGQMVPEFDAFCFAGHKHGDTAVVYGESDQYAGYHVVYYVGEGPSYRSVIAQSYLSSADAEDYVSEKLEACPVVRGSGCWLVGK